MEQSQTQVRSLEIDIKGNTGDNTLKDDGGFNEKRTPLKAMEAFSHVGART